MMRSDQQPEPYGLAPAFERAVVALSCRSPRFYGRIGHELEPDRLGLEPARVAMQAAHAIRAELGHGPDGAVVLVQRLHSLMRAGKLALEQVEAVSDMLDDADDAGLPSEESALNELRPVLAARLRREAVLAAVQAHGQQTDLGKVVALEERAQRLGGEDTSVGVIVGKGSLEDIRALRLLTRLRTGILELDFALAGGHKRGALACFCGDTGAGKSVALSHQAAVAALDGFTVAALTLEVPRAVWEARVIAAVTGTPIDALLADDAATQRAIAQFEERVAGRIVIHQASGEGTTCHDIFAWLDGVQQHLGRPVDVLTVDYADRIYVPQRGGREVGSYDAGKSVMTALGGQAEARNLWLWTASQSRGRDHRRKRLDTSDAADSMHKPRLSDLWITLNVSDDQSEVEFFIAKHRTARSKISVGPLPTLFEIGRIAPIVEGKPCQVARPASTTPASCAVIPLFGTTDRRSGR